MQNSLIQKRIDEFVDEETKINKEILNSLSLYLYASELPDCDIYFLAKIFSNDILLKLVSYADGEPIILPDKTEFRNNYLVSICFYMKEVLNMNWTEIKDVLSLPEKDRDLVSSISIGKKINKIKEKFGHDIDHLLKKIRISDIRDLVKEKEDLYDKFGDK